MSRKNSLTEKARRRAERLNKPLPDYRPIRLSVCKSCGDYTHVFEPANWCSRCLDDVQA